ncbi:thioredoxin domain-containing protein [bacterium]|nr:thioredoxin domain-containing protein [bacterium]
MKKLVVSLIGLSFLAMGCVPASSLKKTLEENPDIVFNVIEKHPAKFMEVVKKAARNAEQKTAGQREADEKKALEEEFKNPKKPDLSGNRVTFGGGKSAAITIVEYSDFECPFCTRGYNTMNQVKKKYGDKVRIIYKHLPLGFHKMAEPASRYFEAIALQSHKKAEKFHDYVFENQDKLKSGQEKFLKQAATKAGANLKKVLKDLNSKEVTAIIEKDKAEAAKFGFSGTPGFLVNGVSVKGAYPMSHFEMIIEKHLKN